MKNNTRKLETVATPKNPVEYDFPLANIVRVLNLKDTTTADIETGALFKCNELVQVFKGFTAENFDTKRIALYVESNIKFRAKKENGKSIVRDDATELLKTASVVISTVRRYVIQEKMPVIDGLTYSQIKQHFIAKKPVISDVRKSQNKRVKALSDKNITKALQLFDDWKKQENQNNSIIKKSIKAPIVKKVTRKTLAKAS